MTPYLWMLGLGTLDLKLNNLSFPLLLCGQDLKTEHVSSCSNMYHVSVVV